MISCFKINADANLQVVLDEHKYDESQLVSIKIPMTYLAYYTNSPFYQRVDGQIEIAGVEYEFVERKLCDDSLEFLCIPNQTAMTLHAAQNDLFKRLTGLDLNENKKSSTGLLKINLADYLKANHFFELHNLLFTENKWSSFYNDRILCYFSWVLENPPEKTSPDKLI
jgi:hypothetical protein